jgi:hypothetical protein
MDEIAIGRKEITQMLRVSWRTVQRYKKADPGFKMLFKVHPFTRKPMLINREVMKYIHEWNKLKKEAKILSMSP